MNLQARKTFLHKLEENARSEFSRPVGRMNENADMKTKRQLSDEILQLLKESSGLRIRAGSGEHRFIGIWHVIVKDRVFVRSWSVKENGWYGKFLKEPHGAIEVKKHETPIVAKRVVNKALRDAVDRAYLAKYKTPGALKYAKDLCSVKSRATTMELVMRQTRTARS